MKMSTFETREFELREREGDAGTVAGIACPFDTLTEDGALYGFREKFAPGAFRNTLKDSGHDVKAFWMHNKEIILGSVRAGTLKLEETEKGLQFEIDLPNNTNGRNAAESIKRGDVDQVSFGFQPVKQEWNDKDNENIVRTITEADLFEVSPEAFGAYGDSTSVSTRAKDRKAEYDDYKNVRDKDKLNEEIKVNQNLIDLRRKQILLHERS